MSRWFCIQHATAGTAADRVCCSSALLTACATDVVLWYRIRVAGKPRGWDAVRWDTARAIGLIKGEARRKGGWFVTARAVA